MKNLLILAIALITSVATAQKNPTNIINFEGTPTIGKQRLMADVLPDELEITITPRAFSTKVNVKLDAGHSQTAINFTKRKNSYLVKGTRKGPRGKNNRIEFNSTSAVLAYFKGLGYHISTLNGAAIGGRGKRWILSK